MSKALRLEIRSWLEERGLARVLAVLNGGGVETRVVGGAVRDAILGREIGDVDLATTAVPSEVVRRAEAAGLRAIPTGIEHGTVTLVADGRPFEITTLREDVETTGRHALVRFGTDWTADAMRRDFTMNALYLSRDGVIHDPLGGYDDVLNRRVRFIGDPLQRIAEDHLRILRFFRFHAAYGEGGPDPNALSGCVRMRWSLLDLSAERIHQEMLRLLVAPRAVEAARVMSETGILQIVLGGVDRLPALQRLAVLESLLGEDADPVRRLGVLAVEVAEDAERLSERMRLSRVELRRLLSMAGGWRWIEGSQDQAGAREALYRSGPDDYADRIRFAAARHTMDEGELSDWADLARLPERWTPPRFPLTGNDIAALGATGPRIGEVLRQVEADWILGGYPEGKDALLDRARSVLG